MIGVGSNYGGRARLKHWCATRPNASLHVSSMCTKVQMFGAHWCRPLPGPSSPTFDPPDQMFWLCQTSSEGCTAYGRH